MIRKFNEVSEEMPIRRYMGLAKLLDILERRHLFFAAMNSFPDALEGGLTAVELFGADGGAARLGHLVNEVWPSTGTLLSVAERKKMMEAQEFEGRSFDPPVATLFGEITLRDGDTYHEIWKRQKNWIDVSCWDRNSSESVAMWNIYGGHGDSVCVHTTVGKLCASLTVPDRFEAYVGSIDYTFHNDAAYTGDHPLGYFMRKHKAYEYEQEIRVVVYDPSNDPLQPRGDSAPGTPLPLNLCDLFGQITISPGSKGWFRDLVVDLVNKRFGLTIPVEMSDLDRLA